jgi:hypothetical protein|tara:strand:- start:1258 stop:1428 length:171 start_codon:yes stop_codon:yes gene_type:complete
MFVYVYVSAVAATIPRGVTHFAAHVVLYLAVVADVAPGTVTCFWKRKVSVLSRQYW